MTDYEKGHLAGLEEAARVAFKLWGERCGLEACGHKACMAWDDMKDAIRALASKPAERLYTLAEVEAAVRAIHAKGGLHPGFLDALRAALGGKR